MKRQIASLSPGLVLMASTQLRAQLVIGEMYTLTHALRHAA